MAVNRLAVIEIGSFELQLEIFDISARNGIRSVDSVCQLLAIGKETYRDEKISYETLDKMCQALGRFCEIAKEYRVSSTIAIAAGGIRSARNCAMVLDQIRVRTGLEVNILSNSEQRFVRYKGVEERNTIFEKMTEKGTAFVDVGSDSMQISIFDKKVLVTTQNLLLGASRISEIIRKADGDVKVTDHLIMELLDNELQTFQKMYLKDRVIKNIVAVGDNLVSYISRSVDPDSNSITKEKFEDYYKQLLNCSEEEISERMELPIEYAGMVLPTIIVYRAMLEVTGAQSILLSEVSLRDGVVHDYAGQHKIIRLKHDYGEDILAASRTICQRYLGNKNHTLGVENNVCKLFDVMKRYHGLGSRERMLLQISAILHDCGKFIRMGEPGDCSYHIIMETEIIGLSHKEREIVANVVRYNTLKFPSYEKFEGRLSEAEYLVVMKLAAILRIANALDRSHKQKFLDSKVVLRDHQLIIGTVSNMDITLEQALFSDKAEFFEEVYGIRPLLKKQVKRADKK